MIGGASSSTSITGTEEEQNLPEAILRWKKKVTKEAVKNQLSEAVPYLLGIIMVESGGKFEKYPDIMQCSESQGRPPNSISDPDVSIEVRIKYFADMWKGHREYEVLNIVQAYNFVGWLFESHWQKLFTRECHSIFQETSIWTDRYLHKSSGNWVRL